MSSEDSVVLVNENVVAHDPHGNKCEGNEREEAGSEESSSGVLSILGEESNEEAGSNAEWGKEYEDDDWEVPVDVLVEDQEEVHGHHVDCKDKGECTEGDDSALDWEAPAAGRVLSVFVRAGAKAAAARSKLLLSSNRDTFVLLWFFFFGSHHRSHFIHHFAVHIKKIW